MDIDIERARRRDLMPDVDPDEVAAIDAEIMTDVRWSAFRHYLDQPAATVAGR